MSHFNKFYNRRNNCNKNSKNPKRPDTCFCSAGLGFFARGLGLSAKAGYLGLARRTITGSRCTMISHPTNQEDYHRQKFLPPLSVLQLPNPPIPKPPNTPEVRLRIQHYVFPSSCFYWAGGRASFKGKGRP
ncbi:hypothetical protein PIB30_081241 [Stylosanthes scabra]|uniref:Uncharacterized protein n=1 Tax=Stylosanthes scabra TaxID=79078 RepID=A0ABU6WPX3_9FABA|nr:hypothetical protein [Stylosanthes scabra]